jgi:hypothetical protein
MWEIANLAASRRRDPEMPVREQIDKQLKGLTDYQSRIQSASQSDQEQLGALYSEFAEEDRQLVEGGMEDYAKGLAGEGGRQSSRAARSELG